MKLFSKFLFTFTFVSSLTHASTNIEDDLRSTHILDLPKEIFAHILQKGTFNNFRGFLSSSRTTRKLFPLGKFQVKMKPGTLTEKKMDEYIRIFSRLEKPIPVFSVGFDGTIKQFEKLVLLWKKNNYISCIKIFGFKKKSWENYAKISNFTGLEVLNLEGKTLLRNISFISSLVNLKKLVLAKTQVSDISALSASQNLERLSLSYTGVVDISPLGLVSKIKVLHLAFCKEITNLSPLTQLTEVEHLDLSGCKRIVDFQPLSNLRNLICLSLQGIPLIDIGFLHPLNNLQFLNLYGTHVTDLSSLARLTNLRKLHLNQTLNPDLSPIQSLIDGGLKIIYG